VKIADCSANG